MKNLKRKKFIDFRENFQKKTKLIEDLKVLISSDLNLKEKEDIFNSIRRKWITIGKVPSHLAFNLNNSYNHQVKLYYDLVYLDRNYKEKDLDKNLLEKKELIVKIKKLNDYGNKIKSYKDSLKIIKRWIGLLELILIEIRVVVTLIEQFVWQKNYKSFIILCFS